MLWLANSLWSQHYLFSFFISTLGCFCDVRAKLVMMLFTVVVNICVLRLTKHEPETNKLRCWLRYISPREDELRWSELRWSWENVIISDERKMLLIENKLLRALMKWRRIEVTRRSEISWWSLIWVESFRSQLDDVLWWYLTRSECWIDLLLSMTSSMMMLL